MTYYPHDSLFGAKTQESYKGSKVRAEPIDSHPPPLL
jgi:hypothetical protein